MIIWQFASTGIVAAW